MKHKLWFAAALLGGALLIGLAYLPSLANGFVSWDDGFMVIYNDQTSLLSLASIGRMFTSFYFGLYHPLVSLTYAVEYHWFGLQPFIYHLDNLLLHILNSGLVMVLLLALGFGPAVAGVAALLFGVHPAHVESVAWATERKDVLYAFFFLSALIAYTAYLKRDDKRFYFLALGLFLFSLLAKAMAVSFPLFMIWCDFLLKKRGERPGWAEKIPAFCLAALFGVLALLARHFTGSITHDPPFSLNNIFVGSYRIIFYYLPRLILPFWDFPLYPGPTFADKAFSSLPPLYLLSPLLLAGLLYLFFRLAKDRRARFGGAFFLIALLPVLFLISVGPFADRFTYVSSIGLLIVGAALLPRRRSAVVAAALLIILLSALTWQRCFLWRDSLSFWDQVCRLHPTSVEALNMRAYGYTDKGDFAKAEADFEHAIKLDPHRVQLYLNLGVTCSKAGELDKALVWINRGLKLNPGWAEAYNNRGIVYGRQGRLSLALADFDRALRLQPDYPEASANRDRARRLLRLAPAY